MSGGGGVSVIMRWVGVDAEMIVWLAFDSVLAFTLHERASAYILTLRSMRYNFVDTDVFLQTTDGR